MIGSGGIAPVKAHPSARQASLCFHLMPAAVSGEAEQFDVVHVQPTVLLACADHHRRVLLEQRQTKAGRVIGGLLGKVDEDSNALVVTNSFAIPYDEESSENGSGLFVENDYVNAMYAMLLKINRNEKLVGWYHTGGQMCTNDIFITKLIKKHCDYPIILRINLEAEIDKIPFEGFITFNDTASDGSALKTNMRGISCKIVAEKSEHVGIEQLMRYIKDPSVSDLTTNIEQKFKGIGNLREQIETMSQYLDKASKNLIVTNNEVIFNIQKIWHMIPELKFLDQKKSLLNSKFNDNSLMMYIASLTRAISGVNSLIENKIATKDMLKSKC